MYKGILQYSICIDFPMMKYHRSKWFIFLFLIKTVFSMFNRILVLFVKVRMPSAPCRLYVASAFDGQCRDSVKASEKTVYNHEK